MQRWTLAFSDSALESLYAGEHRASTFSKAAAAVVLSWLTSVCLLLDNAVRLGRPLGSPALFLVQLTLTGLTAAVVFMTRREISIVSWRIRASVMRRLFPSRVAPAAVRLLPAPNEPAGTPGAGPTPLIGAPARLGPTRKVPRDALTSFAVLAALFLVAVQVREVVVGAARSGAF